MCTDSFNPQVSLRIAFLFVKLIHEKCFLTDVDEIGLHIEHKGMLKTSSVKAYVAAAAAAKKEQKQQKEF